MDPIIPEKTATRGFVSKQRHVVAIEVLVNLVYSLCMTFSTFSAG